MGLDYVDIFYSHRLDASTPLEETMGALDAAVRAGKALYVGISSYDADRTREAAAILDDLGTPLLIHQPSYSMVNRWIETEGLLDAAAELGIGVIGFTALAQGLLTAATSTASPRTRAPPQDKTFDTSWLTDEMLGRLRALNEIAERRGQTLAQLALAWALRDERLTSLVIGASSVAQLEQNVDALDNLELSEDELAEIDSHLATRRASICGPRPGSASGSRRLTASGVAVAGFRLPHRRAGDAQHPGGDRVEPRTRREPETPATLEPEAGRFDRCDGVAVRPTTAHQARPDRGHVPLPAGETDSARPHVLVEAQLAAGAQDAPELGERLTRVGDRAQHSADDHRVGRPGLEVELGRGARHDAHRTGGRPPPARPGRAGTARARRRSALRRSPGSARS